jgi:hypothetical protein
MKYLTLLFNLIPFVSGCTKAPLNSPDLDPTNAVEMTVLLKLTPEPESPMSIQFEVSSTQDQRLCRYHTPLEGFLGDILEVRNEQGDRTAYLGAMVKRLPPGEEDFVWVRIETPQTVSFDLSKHYAVSDGGTYTVQFKGNPAINGLPDSNVLIIAF